MRATIALLVTALLGLSCRGGDEKETTKAPAAGEAAAVPARPGHTQAAFESAVQELGRKPWSEAIAGLEQRFGPPTTLPFREVFPDVVQALREKGQPIPNDLVNIWAAASGDDRSTCVRLTAIKSSSPSQLAVQTLKSDPDDRTYLAYRHCLANANAADALAADTPR